MPDTLCQHFHIILRFYYFFHIFIFTNQSDQLKKKFLWGLHLVHSIYENSMYSNSWFKINEMCKFTNIMYVICHFVIFISKINPTEYCCSTFIDQCFRIPPCWTDGIRISGKSVPTPSYSWLISQLNLEYVSFTQCDSGGCVNGMRPFDHLPIFETSKIKL